LRLEPLPPAEEIEALLGGRPAAGRGLVRASLALAEGLRRDGVAVGLDRVLDGLRSMALVGPNSSADLRRALACNLVASPEEEALFDRLFDRLFLGREAEWSGPDQARPRTASLGWSLGLVETAETPRDRAAPYSPEEVLGRRDLRRLVGQEADRALALLEERLAELLSRPSRRRRPGGRRGRLDFRRTWRLSLSAGGEIVRLAHSRPRTRRRRLVLLLDVSGSMDAHARFLLLFARSWLRAMPGRVEVFAFSTGLKRLTPLLARPSLEAALDEISRLMPEWSGGTRIGASLAQLNLGPWRGLLGSSTVAVIYSDGWDRGDIPLLGRQMARLARAVRAVVWLNPLAGCPDYQPLCAGMRSALPHLDRLLPAHDVASLIDGSRLVEEMLVS